MINKKSLNNSMKYIFQALTISLFFFYILNNFKTNIYEVLFIDERMLIDDIYNLWLLEDLYGRFSDISNPILKNILIIFIELSYGGDLRYGRLWSNIFTLFVGPFSLINDSFVIIISRIFSASLFLLGSYFLSKNIKNKNLTWLVVLTIYSLPAVEYFHRIPKPDNLVLIFVALGIRAILDDKFYRAVLLLSVASFIKINTIIVFFFLWLYILRKTKESRGLFIFKTSIISLISLLVVNPILIIPPIKISNFDLPNFYKIYFNWLTTQSSNGDQLFFNLQNFSLWSDTFSNFYKFPNSLSFTLIMLPIIFVVYLKVFVGNDSLAKYLIIASSFYFLFYFGFIERQYTHYLHLPIALLLISYFRTLDNKNLKFSALLIILFFTIIGNLTNLEKFINDVEFNANSRYGYENIITVSDAEELVSSVVNELKVIYGLNPHLEKNLVYWHPDLFLPRNRVTFNDEFFVREYWGNKETVNFAIDEADIYITYTDYKVTKSVSKSKVQNYFIYYYLNSD
jgi:hypothetical protein